VREPCRPAVVAPDRLPASGQRESADRRGASGVHRAERRVAGAVDGDCEGVSPIGRADHPSQVGDLLAAASRRAGLATAVTPHQLRHAFGSSAADAGCGIDVVADLLGHASTRMLEQHYRHRVRATMSAHVAPMEHLFGSD